jgi:hypothetical protein
MAPDNLTAARADALFASDLSVRCYPDPAAAAEAIRRAVAVYGGVSGCAGEVAASYGEYPETAAERMRWARRVIQMMYPPAAA